MRLVLKICGSLENLSSFSVQLQKLLHYGFRHKSYLQNLYSSPAAKGDIALLKLENKVQFTTTVAPICLPWSTPEKTFANTLGVTMG